MLRLCRAAATTLPAPIGPVAARFRGRWQQPDLFQMPQGLGQFVMQLRAFLWRQEGTEFNLAPRT